MMPLRTARADRPARSFRRAWPALAAILATHPCAGRLEPPAASGGGPGPPAVLRLPFSIEGAAVIRGADEVRTTEVGIATWRALTDAGLVGADTLEAWAALASALKLSPESAFDRVLGRSTTVVVRGLAGDAPTRWALVCEITEDTRHRLLEALRPAARGLGDAAAVLTVEGGRIELALGASVDRGSGVRTAPLILASVSSRDLFDELRATLVSGGIPGEPLGGRDAPNITLIWGDQDTSAWAEVRAATTDSGWALVTRSYPHQTGDERGAHVWTDEAARLWFALDDSPADLAFLSSAAGPELPIPPSLRGIADDLVSALRAPPELTAGLTTLRAVRISRRGSGVWASLLLRGAPGPRFAIEFEGWVGRLLASGGRESIAPDEQVAGLAILGDHAGSTLERLFGLPSAARWFILPSKEPGGGAWALLDVRPFEADTADRAGKALRRRVAEVAAASSNPVDGRGLAVVGRARPRALAHTMRLEDGPLAALRWIDRVEVVVPARRGPAGPGPTSVEASWTIDLDLTRLAPPPTAK